MEPDFPHGRAFRPAPAAVQLACSLFYSIPPPLVNARDPFEIRFYSLKSSPCQLGCPPEKPSHRPCSIPPSSCSVGFSPHSGMPPFLACCQTCPAAVFLPSGRHPWDPYHRRPVRFHSLPMSEMDRGRSIYQRAVICLLAIRGRRNGPIQLASNTLGPKLAEGFQG